MWIRRRGKVRKPGTLSSLKELIRLEFRNTNMNFLLYSMIDYTDMENAVMLPQPHCISKKMSAIVMQQYWPQTLSKYNDLNAYKSFNDIFNFYKCMKLKNLFGWKFRHIFTLFVNFFPNHKIFLRPWVAKVTPFFMSEIILSCKVIDGVHMQPLKIQTPQSSNQNIVTLKRKYRLAEVLAN